MPVLAAPETPIVARGHVAQAVAASERAAGARHLPFLIVAGALSFNGILAAVNGNLVALTPAVVIATEIVLVGAALALGAWHYRPSMRLPIAFIAYLFVFMVLRAAIVDPATSVKYFRDLMIAPAFLILGLGTDRHHLDRYVLLFHAVVVAVAVLEAFRVELYSQIFQVKDYFIATRGLTEADFWNTTSDLFVSATRPDARFLSIVDAYMDAHRVSSIFLEPVSLGGYCIVATAYLFARWESLGLVSRASLLLTIFFLMVACDGRLAFVSFAVLAVVCTLWRLLPRYTTVLYLPGVLLLAFAFVLATGHPGGGDDFPGRIAWTVDLLNAFGPAEILGMSEAFITKAVDSGVAYIVTTQSVVGLLLFWGLCAFSSRLATRSQIRYAHALCIYIAFNALVSYGFLSIKTAALLWVVKGVLETEPDEARA